MISAGADGCRFGWIAVTKRAGALDYALFATAAALADAFAHAERIFIDIPIGLPWRDYPVRESCMLARRALGERRASVFPIPCRDAVHAPTLERARAINLAELGRSLSAQSWNICAKIAEVDTLLRSGGITTRFRETHPELAFAQLAGGAPMRHSKKSAAGIRERVGLLRRFEPGAPKLLRRVLEERPRKMVAPDDVVDALVAYVVSARAPSKLRTYPAHPPRDQHGLCIEVVYALP
jgi:predicted RNase H-like nuclease